MLFNSYIFALFLPTVLAVYYLLPWRRQNHWLLVCSYVFYGWWDWRFLSLILLSTVIDFTAGAMIGRCDDRPGVRKAGLIVSIAANLGILGFFKYFNFFADSLAALLGVIGWRVDAVTLQFVLPVGISFYTFQTMSYTIDVYRRQMAPTRDFLLFALYVSYFPQLVAGPIERASRLLPQLAGPRRVDVSLFSSGWVLILIGLFKKVVLADSVATSVDADFAAASTASAGTLLRAAYLFAIQIYCDFSGYSDIARGASRLFGIELMENFNQPYLSTNITEFWRRWHISLSTWLRDYLYIPLGGSRTTPARTHVNLMTTMFLGGLWHGANWTFVIWGLIHGFYLAAHKLVLGDRKPPERLAVGGWRGGAVFAAKWAATFHLVVLTWIFFRCPDVRQAFEYLGAIVSGRGGWSFEWAKPAMLVSLLLAVDLPQYWMRDHTAILKAPVLVRGGYYAAMALLIVIMGGGADAPFIYFQF